MRISPSSFTSEQHEFTNDFISRPGGRYLYGRTEEALSIANIVNVDGFIDDFTSETSFHGLPCLKLNHIPSGARVISTVVQAFANAAISNLKEKKLDFVDYFAFKAISNLPLKEIPYWVGAKEHFADNQHAYFQLYDKLADSESKDTLERVMNFRLNHDLREMAIFKANLKGMYFEPFLKIPNQNAIFFDVGSYDGYNSIHFAQLYPDMAMTLLFEPIPAQANMLAQQFRDRPNFKVFDLAISDEDGEVKFNIDSTASRLSKDGSGIIVKTSRLDTFCEQHACKPSLIKMDIEGSEIKALQGARETIERYRPNLAISVYHNVTHLTDAFAIISSLNPTYKYYIRHYTEGYTETVLFAVP